MGESEARNINAQFFHAAPAWMNQTMPQMRIKANKLMFGSLYYSIKRFCKIV